MSVSSSATAFKRREFLTVAEELSVLSAPTITMLREESAAQGIPPIQLALQKALVTPAQIEIIETLCRPFEIVPGYEVRGVIGQGGMGIVFRARQMSLNRDVAIKLVPLNSLGGDVAVRRFEVEAQVVAKLSHPNIVAAYDFGKHEGRLYFVMELVDGQDADHHIRRHGAFDETTAWQIVRQAAAGLAHAQQAGVVHRDVKPANILLVKPPAGYPLPAGVPLAKLGDFGLAWLTTASDERTRLTSTNITLGSPHYMAPEQLTGDTVDWRADIYSLGATTYHLLSGLPPMSGVDMTRLMAMKLQGKSDSLRLTRPDITPTSADLVDELMAANPRNRPQDYGVLIERIDELIGQQGLSTSRRMLASTQLSAVKPPPPPDPNAVTQPTPRDSTISNQTIEIPDEPPSSRRTWILAAAAVLLALIAAGALALQWLNTPGKPDLETFGAPISLPYTKESFQEWKPISGSWGNLRNKDDEPVIQGNGVLSRSFAGLATEQNNQLRNYRLQLFVELNKAEVVEVHVGFVDQDHAKQAGPVDHRRVVLRVTAKGAQLGHKLDDTQGWYPRSPLVPLVRKTAGGGKHSILLERHTAGWQALLDGDTVVGFVNAPPRPEAHEFRLLAGGGDAWFSDFDITELRKTPK
jgi:serine/threonine protein kinase